MWRVCSDHINNEHAKKKEGIRQTLADFFSLMIRDRVDVVTGDFNQAHHFIGEVLENLARLHPFPISWALPGPTEEIRTIMFNWPVIEDNSLETEPVQKEMWVREVTTFDRFDVEDVGLRATDTDSHCPSLFIIRKSSYASHADRHSRSAAGKEKDRERRKRKAAEKKAAAKAAAAKAAAAKASSSLTGMSSGKGSKSASKKR